MKIREDEIRHLVEEWTGKKVRGPLRVWDDTTHYFRIGGGSVVCLGGRYYYVTGDAREGRFGIEDQPKFWVKYAVDLERARKKVIKLVFHETLELHVGPHRFPGKRSPKKEARVLDVVRGQPGFMQGVSVKDTAGNLVRVIDFIPGPSLYGTLRDLDMDHEAYFHEELPGILAKLMKAFEGIEFLRRQGEHHGDIRNDHLLVEPDEGRYIWIDFDYGMRNPDYDLWCMGNVLTCVIGKGNHYFNEYQNGGFPAHGRDKAVALSPDDALLFFKHRIANLRKLYPYIPEKLGRILLRFSAGTPSLYPSIRALIHDVRDACPEMEKAAGTV